MWSKKLLPASQSVTMFMNRIELASIPFPDRFPPPSLRAATTFLFDLSAGLLSGGTPGPQADGQEPRPTPVPLPVPFDVVARVLPLAPHQGRKLRVQAVGLGEPDALVPAPARPVDPLVGAVRPYAKF